MTDQNAEARTRAMKRIGTQFHTTRLSHALYSDPTDLSLLLEQATLTKRLGSEQESDVLTRITDLLNERHGPRNGVSVAVDPNDISILLMSAGYYPGETVTLEPLAQYALKIDDGKGGFRYMTRSEAIARYGEPDAEGHIERSSDSGLYEGVCVMCGVSDRHPGYKRQCPVAATTEAPNPAEVLRDIAEDMEVRRLATGVDHEAFDTAAAHCDSARPTEEVLAERIRETANNLSDLMQEAADIGITVKVQQVMVEKPRGNGIGDDLLVTITKVL